MPEHPIETRDTLRIAVVGGGRCGPDTRRAAFEVGRRIAEAGALLLCGGGSGVMEAAAEGAQSAGGGVIGIMPGADRHHSPPNRFVTLPIYTGLGQGRNLVLVLTAQAVVAIGGEWGTLSEIALARKHGRPVVSLGSWGLEAPEGAVTASNLMPVVVDGPAEAADTAITLARQGGAER